MPSSASTSAGPPLINEPRRSWLWRPDFHSGERGSNPRRFALIVIALAILAGGTLDYASAVTEDAIRKDAPGWDVTEGPTPVRLEDCKPEDVIAISKNSGVRAPWTRFCYGRTR